MFFFSMPGNNPFLTAKNEPVYNISTLFNATRDLRPYAKRALVNTGLSIEESDILIALYGESELNWNELPVNPEGLIALKNLREALVQDASLFGRRLKTLTAMTPPLVELEDMKSHPLFPVHGNSQGARLTPAGKAVAGKIWESFIRLSTRLLDGIPKEKLSIHEEINRTISQRLKELANPAPRLLADLNDQPE